MRGGKGWFGLSFIILQRYLLRARVMRVAAITSVIKTTRIRLAVLLPVTDIDEKL